MKTNIVCITFTHCFHTFTATYVYGKAASHSTQEETLFAQLIVFRILLQY